MNIKVLGGGCCKCESLLEAVKEAVAEKGLLGAFTGGLTAAAGGITAAVAASLLAALIFKSTEKY